MTINKNALKVKNNVMDYYIQQWFKNRFCIFVLVFLTFTCFIVNYPINNIAIQKTQNTLYNFVASDSKTTDSQAVINGMANTFASQNMPTYSDNRRTLTIVMYHSILKSVKNDYTISPIQFENDLKELTKRGYVTVLPTEIINYITYGGYFPDKPLLITFDDGHYNNMFYCLELLKKYNCKANINVIGSFSEFSSSNGDDSKPMYSYLTWKQIKELANSGIFEIGHHSYNMHKLSPRYGISKMKNESEFAYKKAFTNDFKKLQNKLIKDCGITPVCFAYPFGRYNSTAKKIMIDEGIKMFLTCSEKRNTLTIGKNECLYELCRFNRNPSLSSPAFFNHMEKTALAT